MKFKLYTSGGELTSPFGPRMLNGTYNVHKGVDYVGRTTPTVISTVDGVVESSTIITNKSNLTWQWGNYVKVRALDGSEHFFCHLQTRLVRKGDTVKVGSPIGIQGNTGYSFGVHCHYEVRVDGKSIDPEVYFMSKDVKDVSEAIDVLVNAGLINTPTFWVSACSIVRNLDLLFIKIANYIK